MRRNVGDLLFPLIVFALAGLAPAQAQTRQTASSSQYFFVLLNRPSDTPQLTQEEGEKLQGAHMGNIRKMTAEHKLTVAFMDDTVLRGIFVFRADSAAEAQDWANSDPAVKAGRLSAEVHGPWLIDPSALHQPGETTGLDQYTLVLMKKSEKWKADALGFDSVLEQHAIFTKQMTANGSLAVGGLFPLSVPGELRAVDIFRKNAAQTATLLKDDPAVKAGLLSPEIHAWATGKGVLAPGQPLK